MSTPPVDTAKVTTPPEPAKPARKRYRFDSYPMNFIFPSGRVVPCMQGTIQPVNDEEEAYLDKMVEIGNLHLYNPEFDDLWVQSQTYGNYINL